MAESAEHLQRTCNELRILLAAALFRLNPEFARNGADVTFLPHELTQSTGWTVAVYAGIGMGVNPPVRVTLTRPQVTVQGSAEKVVRGELES